MFDKIQIIPGGSKDFMSDGKGAEYFLCYRRAIFETNLSSARSIYSRSVHLARSGSSNSTCLIFQTPNAS